MTAAEFLAQLPRDPVRALEELDGALAAEVYDPHWTPMERHSVLDERYRLKRSLKKRSK